jgi:2'-5' RNA ligase
MRLFLAIELSDASRRVLGEMSRAWRENWIEELGTECPPASWVREENLHVTLKFLGEVSQQQAPPLCDALGVVTGEAMRLQPHQIECLPERGAVRVISAGVAGDLDKLHGLLDGIEQACEPLGFARERRRYRPHITLARVRPFLPPYTRTSLTKAGATHLPAPQFLAGEFVLMQSHLHPNGARYIPLARFPLAKKMD